MRQVIRTRDERASPLRAPAIRNTPRGRGISAAAASSASMAPKDIPPRYSGPSGAGSIVPARRRPYSRNDSPASVRNHGTISTRAGSVRCGAYSSAPIPNPGNSTSRGSLALVAIVGRIQ
jgi:hypothetical protein